AEIARRAAEALAEGLLFAPEAATGGYVYVLTYHDAARRRSRGEPELMTLHGDDLRPAKRAGALPEPAAELMAYVRRYIAQRHPDGRGVAPSDPEVAAFLHKRGFQDAAPRVPEPDARLARKVEDAALALAGRMAPGRGPVASEIATRAHIRREK